ncbi:ferredoxin hydrogenase [Acididesulfobacillus acetoxydans]|uniref:Ferredoxin hydrogenase n=1 Tax=Acididesulfobacillus acetoxydans TaxID=1561005 RepID=A0A8S0VY21_9FIRM|nr:NADH-dependent [FeFe] hydrogenase, group A6 [Acididesulfobacillus acetoxydans]CAA7602513.1 ferredoxin hydrogenase [Acididesulfobacillus acetoxydans]CEJ05968.1 NADP-reducing hydrogenase subunit HndC [Acididesulfobacillus acetoxydans]
MAVELTINDIPVSVPEGTTILDAARTINIDIPTLCYLNLHEMKLNNHIASCRVCVVEVEGRRTLAPSCSTPVTPGMVVKTDTPRAIKARRTMVELLLSDHPKSCLTCSKNLDCDLQALASDLGVRNITYEGEESRFAIDKSSKAIVRDPNKCIRCRRCETMCNEVQTVGVYSAVGRGFETVVKTAFDLPQHKTSCTFCGQCLAVCPTGALTELDQVDKVWKALNDPERFVIAETAPAVRVALGEGFGLEPGAIVTGKMVAALKRLGFDRVFDTEFAADLTIVEEATELMDRLKKGGRLPILTSCCPAWVKFFEHQFPDLLDIPSTCKSPHEMFGVIAKKYYADLMGIDPQRITVVSVMPCVAKKYEAARPELGRDPKTPDVDIVITTRELARMIREAGIHFGALPDEDFDQPLGESTGAAVIFGTTGGVIEAALRTAYEWITGRPLARIEFEEFRGMEGIKEAVIDMAGRDFRVAVTHGLGNARKILEKIQAGDSEYDAIEIMACPGGCIGGGGQPYHHGNMEILKARAAAIYREDRNKTLRKSHENPAVRTLYEKYLGEPYGEKAHMLLHTHYIERRKI